jgi:hypothetical protein
MEPAKDSILEDIELSAGGCERAMPRVDVLPILLLITFCGLDDIQERYRHFVAYV